MLIILLINISIILFKNLNIIKYLINITVYEFYLTIYIRGLMVYGFYFYFSVFSFLQFCEIKSENNKPLFSVFISYFHYFLHKILKIGKTRNKNKNQTTPKFVKELVLIMISNLCIFQVKIIL